MEACPELRSARLTAGVISRSNWWPSLPRSKASSAPSSSASPARSTTAPAPSPNSARVERSAGSRVWLKVSTPTSSALSASPALISEPTLARP
ncbi:hypothetical protein P4112_23330 [Pseudomonas aeruginosa]|nr:hypothetical protein [Pseudomonas aeruginosa]